VNSISTADRDCTTTELEILVSVARLEAELARVRKVRTGASDDAQARSAALAICTSATAAGVSGFEANETVLSATAGLAASLWVDLWVGSQESDLRWAQS
jgi:hypothetical protein